MFDRKRDERGREREEREREREERERELGGLKEGRETRKVKVFKRCAQSDPKVNK